MNNVDNSPVEQLWYTWSDVGLSTIHAGFRIRAASPGLTEIYSERVKNIERNMRYVLPPGTDRSITPDMAPVGLAFIRSDSNNEYLLIHKKYTGADGVGRQGNFFAHALALGENRDFSTEDAIWHWRDAIWKTDDRSLDGRSTSLSPLSIDEVYKTTISFGPAQFRQVQDALQFVIEAYLIRKSRSVPIYIAAPASQPDTIATIIAGLTNCLPAQLLDGLTFSTYEPDITKTNAEIVGTSWIPISTNQDSAVVLPPATYFDKLAINCETGHHSELLNHPQALYNPLAADFAAYAAESLATGNVEQLYSFRDYTEKSRMLDIPLFLQTYRGEIADTTSMDERGIETVLTSDLCVEWLGRKSSRTKIIDRAIDNPSWGGGRLKDILRSLRGQAASTVSYAGRTGASSLSEDSEQMASIAAPEIRPRRRNTKGSAQTKKSTTTLAGVLALLAKNIVPEVKRYLAGPRGSRGENLNSTHRQAIVLTLIALMDSCLLPQDEMEVWERLFLLIEDSNPAIKFLTADWTVQSQFLRIWDRVFPSDWQYNDRMPPLSRISWSHLGDLLKLHLETRHPTWVLSSIHELIIDPNTTLTSQVAKELERTSSFEIAAFLNDLRQGRHLTNGTPLIAIDAALTIRLVEKGYTVNPSIASHIEYLLEALSNTGQWRTAKDLVMALLSVSYVGSERYQNLVATFVQNLLQSPQKAAGLDLADALIKHDFPRSWLVDLFIMFNGTPANLLEIIPFVYPKPEEQSAFFIQHGANYLGIPEYIRDMLTLYRQLLPLNGKQQRLFVLLGAITDQATILSLLQLTQPSVDEWYALLERYGQRYLQHFQQVPELANMVVTNFAKLVQTGYPHELLFSLLPAPPNVAGEDHVGQLLAVKELTDEQQASFLERFGKYYSVSYPQMPVLRKYIGTYIANFHVDLLEREASNNFLGFLTHNSNYRKLSLDETTIDSIEHWQTIGNYLHQPSTSLHTLQSLASALYLLNLPNNRQFTIRLAHAFSSCIQTHSDISAIVGQMQEVPKLAKERTDKYQFLYLLAEEAAERSLIHNSSQISLESLKPYLVFALSVYSDESKKHFLQNFLDKLLYHIEVHGMQEAWTRLNVIVEQQGLQDAAMRSWQDYLTKLELGQVLEAKERSSVRLRRIFSWRPSLPKKQVTNNLPNGVNDQVSSLDNTQQAPPANNITMRSMSDRIGPDQRR